METKNFDIDPIVKRLGNLRKGEFQAVRIVRNAILNHKLTIRELRHYFNSIDEFKKFTDCLEDVSDVLNEVYNLNKETYEEKQDKTK